MQVHALKSPAPNPKPSTSARAHALPRGVQAKLKLGGAQDEAEKQADRIAARALQQPVGGIAKGNADDGRASVRRALAGGGSETEPPRLDAPVEEEQALPDGLEREIAALQADGQPLPPPLRADMEGRFGMDLSTVRIHTDARANALNEALHAHAFTVGEHIAFNDGRFQPETGAGRFLLAHELAHVAQQRGEGGDVAAKPVRRGFWGDLYDSAVETLGDIAEWTADQLGDFVWDLLERISPEFARTVRAINDEGILTWLGRQVARAWDAYIGTLRSLVPFDGPRQLIDLFAGLVERAARIAVALASGDCAPLMAAIGELKTFVVETVGVAWDKLTEFLRPVGEFFSGLWANFGAPAVQWLQEFGGEVWQGIQALGQQFWEWIRPVREAAEQVWNWFSDLLFGSEEAEASGGSEGGVVGWISRKAGEAWDWVKERTRPVWQPVAEFAQKVAEFIPPAFVREMGESAQQLSAGLDSAAEDMNGGEGVPESRDTLASVLPSVENIIAAIRRIIVGAGQWLGERIAAVAANVTGLLGRLRASELLSWLADGLGWLAEAVDSLLAWAREKVAVLFEHMVQGFDRLTPFIQLLLETVRKVIEIYADILKLPVLILNGIWQRVPACIREPIENFIQTQILGRIPVFGQFFTDPTLWPRVRDTALGILRSLFVDGDIPKAAWQFFQSVLRILGLPPELVVQVLAKAARAVGDILTNPLGFLINLMRAMGAGFQGFFGNIGTHLLNGFTGWLFGTVREAGITPPADFSIRSVLGFVMEVLGVTVDNIFARLARKLDPAVVARLRSTLEFATGAWSFIATLVTEGPAGLWRELSEQLSNLWDSVVQGVVGFITEKVIGWASRWLISLLDVSGIMPVINTLIAIYKAIESFMQYLREMLEIVSRVLDGIVSVAQGSIGEAAGFMERALASSLPVAIGFLANQAGLGRLSQRLHELIGGLRAKVENAIDWLLDKAIAAGRAIIDMARRGVSAVKQGVADLREWWRARQDFKGADGEDHHLYFRGEGANASLIVESEPQSFQSFLDGRPASKDKDEAQRLYDELLAAQRSTGTAASGTATPAAGATGASPPAPTAQERRIVDLTHDLSKVAAKLMGGGAAAATPPIYGPLREGFGTSVEVHRLTKKIPPGSEPSVEGGLWNILNQRRHGKGSYYIRGHLLNHNIGGAGYTWANLTPLTRSANTSMSSSFEEKVKDAVNKQGATVYFKVQAEPGNPPDRNAEIAALRAPGNPNTDDAIVASVIEAERALPAKVTGFAHKVPDGTPPDAAYSSSWPEIAKLDQTNEPERALKEYSVSDSARTPVYLSNSSDMANIKQLPGVTDGLAMRISELQKNNVVFRTEAQFLSQTNAPIDIFDGFRNSSRYIVRLYTQG
ncbi:MAG: DUF4157 domain-containing protein [Betaproteobacteria bacterium]|nr:DUF4157 domain-containing protein [Betaproteobacteria bacterium]